MSTTFDFTPLFRSSIGFDRMLNALQAASRVESIDNWPPYDIEKSGEDAYRVSLAVAGFGQDDLTITQEQNMLMVTGQKAGEDSAQYLHRGIAGRDGAAAAAACSPCRPILIHAKSSAGVFSFKSFA